MNFVLVFFIQKLSITYLVYINITIFNLVQYIIYIFKVNFIQRQYALLEMILVKFIYLHMNRKN